MCGDEETAYELVHKRIIPRSKDPHAINNNDVSMTSREKHIFKNHYAVCDSLISH